MTKAQPMPKKPETKAPHRIRIIIGTGNVVIENPMPGVEVEVRDYGVPEDWEGSIGRDDEGDRFEFMLFNDKGEHVEGATPPDEYKDKDGHE